MLQRCLVRSASKDGVVYLEIMVIKIINNAPTWLPL